MNGAMEGVLKNGKNCTAVQIYFDCGATIGALWTKFISTAVRFFDVFQKNF